MIEENILKNELKTGKVIRLSSITKLSNGNVCALYPYQPFVSERTPDSIRINAYLRTTGYQPDESYWAIVVIDTKDVHLSKFKRSEDLDILATHEIQPEHKAKLSEGFEPTDCASLQKAAITKIESRRRTFLVMGEIKGIGDVDARDHAFTTLRI